MRWLRLVARNTIQAWQRHGYSSLAQRVRRAPPGHRGRKVRPDPQEQLARGQRGVAEQVFAGTYPYHAYQPLKELVPQVDLAAFLYISSLVRAGFTPARVARRMGWMWPRLQLAS